MEINHSSGGKHAEVHWLIHATTVVCCVPGEIWRDLGLALMDLMVQQVTESTSE